MNPDTRPRIARLAGALLAIGFVAVAMTETRTAQARPSWPQLPTDAEIAGVRQTAERQAQQPDPSKVEVIEAKTIKKYDPAVPGVASAAVFLTLYLGEPCTAGFCPDGFWNKTWGLVEALEYQNGAWSFQVLTRVDPRDPYTPTRIDPNDLDRWIAQTYPTWKDGWPDAPAPPTVIPPDVPDLRIVCPGYRSRVTSMITEVGAATDALNGMWETDAWTTVEGQAQMVAQARHIQAAQAGFAAFVPPPGVEEAHARVAGALASSNAAIDHFIAAVQAADPDFINGSIGAINQVGDTLVEPALDDLLTSFNAVCTPQ